MTNIRIFDGIDERLVDGMNVTILEKAIMSSLSSGRILHFNAPPCFELIVTVFCLCRSSFCS